MFRPDPTSFQKPDPAGYETLAPLRLMGTVLRSKYLAFHDNNATDDVVEFKHDVKNYAKAM